jgi:hypothetical protein
MPRLKQRLSMVSAAFYVLFVSITFIVSAVRDIEWGDDFAGNIFVVAPLIAGFVVGRLWAVFLPFATVPSSLAFVVAGQDVGNWLFGVTFYLLLLGVLAAAVGVLARVAMEWAYSALRRRAALR